MDHPACFEASSEFGGQTLQWGLGKEANEGAEERADAHHDVRWGPGAADTMRGEAEAQKGAEKKRKKGRKKRKHRQSPRKKRAKERKMKTHRKWLGGKRPIEGVHFGLK